LKEQKGSGKKVSKKIFNTGEKKPKKGKNENLREFLALIRLKPGFNQVLNRF